ncbi:MAG: hypothetical protein WBF51_00795 [Candidatus Dormiibacterota bacterium]
MSDDLTPDERRVADVLSSVGPPRHRLPVPAPRPLQHRWLAVVGAGALIVVVAVSAIILPRALGSQHGHGKVTPLVSPSKTPTVSPSITPAVPALYVAAGARVDAGQDQWVVSQSSLAVTRDGGGSWTHLPLPAKSSEIVAITVLPTETVAVTEVSPFASVTIDTMTVGETAWQPHTVNVAGGQVGTVQIVDSNGTLAGLMIVLTTSAQFSQGVWLGTPDGGKTWQTQPTPVGGTASAVAGGLWLVGGVLNQDVYLSSDSGASWDLISVPATVGSSVAYGPVQADESGVVLTATLANSGETQVVTGSDSGSGWHWTDGPILSLGGQSGAGAPALSSVADGVLWIVSPVNEVGLVTLSSGRVSQVSASGLPSNGTLSLSAYNSQAAVATYSTYVCPAGKSGCTMEAGMVATTDGGQVWSPIADPFSS